MPSDSSVLGSLIKRLKHLDVDPLRPAIDRYLLERDRSPNRYREHVIDMRPRTRPGGRLSPSALCGCQRQAAFKFLGVRGRRKIDPDQELIWEDGIWRHHKWNAVWYDMQAVLGAERFKVISTEEPIEIPELYIAGHLDNVLRISMQKYVVDMKGINEYGFQDLMRDLTHKTPHERQLLAYERGRGIYKGILLYDCKNNQDTHGFVVKFEQSLWQEVQEWCEAVLNDLERKVVPPMHPDCQRGTFLYQKCPYSGICFGNSTRVEIRSRAYRDFVSLDRAWERGHEEADQ